MKIVDVAQKYGINPEKLEQCLKEQSEIELIGQASDSIDDADVLHALQLYKDYAAGAAAGTNKKAARTKKSRVIIIVAAAALALVGILLAIGPNSCTSPKPPTPSSSSTSSSSTPSTAYSLSANKDASKSVADQRAQSALYDEIEAKHDKYYGKGTLGKVTYKWSTIEPVRRTDTNNILYYKFYGNGYTYDKYGKIDGRYTAKVEAGESNFSTNVSVNWEHW